MDVRSVPQDAAVQLVQRSVDKVTLLVEKDAEQQFKNSEFYSLVRNSGPSFSLLLSLNQSEKQPVISEDPGYHDSE